MAVRVSTSSSESDRPGILTKLMDRLRQVQNAESVLRQNMAEDLDFFSGEGQWPGNVKSERELDGRPCLTINRIPQFVSQVTSMIRSNRPAVQVNPTSGGARPDVAEALQGVIRNIETNSDADTAYDTGVEYQAITGRGYVRVITAYAEDDDFDQVLEFVACPNPLLIFCDIAAQKPDKTDKRFAVILEDIPKDDFIDEYGEAAYVNGQSFFATNRDLSPDWMPEGRVRVAEYYYKDIERAEMVDIKVPDGKGGFTEHRLEDSVLPSDKDMEDAGWEIVDRRHVMRTTIKWLRATPYMILEGNKDKTGGRRVPGRMIPVFDVLGQQLNINGRSDVRGMVRNAKDPARMISFWASSITEIIALTPRAPYIGYEGQFKGHENKWNTANKRSYAYLEVVPTTIGGQPAPFPQRTQFSPAIQAMVDAFQLADNDLKSVMGMYDASLGRSGPEQSGAAILARQRQGEVGNSVYQDNVNRTVRACGRYLLQAIPEVYAPKRVLRILGVDDKQRTVLIHDGSEKLDHESLKAAQGITDIYDISVGRYDISISSGPSFKSRREESVKAMLELVKVYPQAAPAVADLMVANMDWPGAAQIAGRLKRMVPPTLLGEEDGGKAPIPAEQFEQLQKAFQEMKQKLDAKALDIQSRERVAQLESQTEKEIASAGDRKDLLIAEMKNRDAERDRQFDGMMRRLELQLEHMQEIRMSDTQRENDIQVAQQTQPPALPSEGVTT